VARIAVMVLAAGQSSRFSDRGAHKLLARLGDATVVRHAVRAAIESGVGDVHVVTGAEATGVAAALDGLDTHLVHEPAYAGGMATSLRRGVSTLDSSVDAVLVALGDQPALRPQAYQRVAAAWRDSGAAIVVPRYAGSDAPSHPALFDATVFGELLALQGDIGARVVIAREPSRVKEVRLDWPAPRDIDTADDLALVAAEWPASVSRQLPKDAHAPPSVPDRNTHR